MQFCDIVQHLKFLDLLIIFLHTLHDDVIVVLGVFLLHLGFLVRRRRYGVLRVIVISASFDVELNLVTQSFDLHDLSLQSRILLHVVAVDTIQLGIYRYL